MECKNCGKQLLGEDKFCNQCGAKIITKRLELKEIISEWFSSILNIDNKFISTYLHLFSQPQIVIIGYIEGLRKKYVSPINYLLLTFGIYGFFTLFYNIEVYHDQGIAGIFEGAGYLFGEDELQTLKILNLPISFFQVLIFASAFKYNFKRQYNYAENLIIAAYWSGQILLTSTFFSFLLQIFNFEIGYIPQFIILIFMILYSLWVQKKVFQHSWLKHLFLLMVFIITSFILYHVYLTIIGFFIYLF